MRVALLSTLEPSADDTSLPRGLVRVGGRSVVRHQLDAALALECEKVLCLADGLPGELIALQHAAERQGASFQTLPDGRAVARAVRPEDELLVFADGLVASADAVAMVLGARPGVVVQPVESGVAAGYERIDLNHAGAGVLRVPGRVAQDLADLPPDWNPVSALLRLATQAATRQAVLPQALAGDGRWTLVRTDAEAHRLEPRWLRQHTERVDARGPGRWLAARAIEQLGPALLHAGTRPVMLSAGAAATALIGLICAWFGLPAVGFALMGAGWVIRRAGGILARVGGEAVPRGLARLRSETSFGVVLDACFMLACAWTFAAQAPASTTALVEGAFSALVLFGLLRLVAKVLAAKRWHRWIEDRLLAGLALAGASLSGVFDLALMGGVLGLLALALIETHAATGDEPAGEEGREPQRLTPP